MKAIDFPEANVKIAETQPEYETLPAYVAGDGEVTVCFKLEKPELDQVLETGCIWLSFLTFGQPFQPIYGSCLKPQFQEK